jgi:hypothetical protein
MARMKQDPLKRISALLATACGHDLGSSRRVAELDTGPGTELMYMVDGRNRAGMAPRLQFLKSFTQCWSNRKIQMRRMPRCLIRADPDMKELQMGGKRPRCHKGGCEDSTIRIAAADRDQE